MYILLASLFELKRSHLSLIQIIYVKRLDFFNNCQQLIPVLPKFLANDCLRPFPSRKKKWGCWSKTENTVVSKNIYVFQNKMVINEAVKDRYLKIIILIINRFH